MEGVKTERGLTKLISGTLMLSHGIAMKCLVDPSFGLLEGQFAFELYQQDITITFLPSRAVCGVLKRSQARTCKGRNERSGTDD